jgi:sorting nexin-29
MPDNDSNDQETRAYYTVDQEVPLVPSLDETITAIHTLKNNKASGEDRINSEFWRIEGPEVERELHSVILQLWEEERFPESWNETLICPIFKKGDRRKVKHYRGITILNTRYKVLSLIILKRLKKYTEKAVGGYQCRFRKGRSTTDHIFVVRQLMEKHYEYAKDLHMAFVDYKQAYDSIDRERLWEALRAFGIPMKIIKMIKLCKSKTYSREKFGNELSMAFKIKSGLRQGDAMSPILFNMALESVVREMLNGEA